MEELDDNSLLRQYAEHNSEAAFAALVTRHVNKVYSVALRHTRNAHAAEEITQAVFIVLAKKSARLGRKVVLSGWLYETARLTALTYIRSEIRRSRREQEAHLQTALNENTDDAWPHIAPLLDDALAKLNETDRHAIVLRYFDGKSLGEVGAALAASEEAAKKRVTRAVEKLRGWFIKRGVTLTATVLTAAISANSVQAAPQGLTAMVMTTTAKGSVISATTATLVKGTMKLMSWLKVKFLAGVSAAVLATVGAATVAVSGDRDNTGSDEPSVVAFKHYLSRPPRIARLIYSESQTGRRFFAAVDGDSFFYRELKDGENPDLPISVRNRMRSSMFVGRSGEMRWQIDGFEIKEAVNAQAENPDAYTAFADSSRVILNGIFSFSSQLVEPGSFSWNGNKFEARLSKLYKSNVRGDPPLPDTVSGSIKVKDGNVVEMSDSGRWLGTASYEYDSAAHLPIGVPSKITRGKQTYVIHELVLMDKNDARPEMFLPETHVEPELVSITVVSNSQQTFAAKANKLATEVIYQDLQEQKAILQNKSSNRRVIVKLLGFLVALSLSYFGIRFWRRR